MRLKLRRPIALMVAVSLADACAPRSPSSTIAAQTALDSLIVDRGACYGTCDTYQIVVRRREPTTVRRKSVESPTRITVDEAQRLLADAAAAGTLALPAVIRSDSTLCPLEATDHSTIILTAYSARRVNRVEHYTGCYIDHALRVAPPLEQLVILERRIDALVSVKP